MLFANILLHYHQQQPQSCDWEQHQVDPLVHGHMINAHELIKSETGL